MKNNNIYNFTGDKRFETKDEIIPVFDSAEERHIGRYGYTPLEVFVVKEGMSWLKEWFPDFAINNGFNYFYVKNPGKQKNDQIRILFYTEFSITELRFCFPYPIKTYSGPEEITILITVDFWFKQFLHNSIDYKINMPKDFDSAKGKEVIEHLRVVLDNALQI